MVSWLSRTHCGPIGVDIGSQAVKLVQLNAARTTVRAAVRWNLAGDGPAADGQRDQQIIQAIRRAREGRGFRGREAVFCLGAGDLFVQNLRVAQSNGDELAKIVQSEAAGRLPFSSDEAEIRFVEAADVRQGDVLRREVILLACHRPAVDRMLSLAEDAGLRPIAIDVEPMALLRCYCKQVRRDEDQQRRVMFVSVGACTTAVVIARGPSAMFVKYIGTGGRHFDEAVAQHLKVGLADAAALRRQNADRRADQRDPEISRTINESVRPVLDRLAGELSLCLRYYSVTFRGQPLSQTVLGGGEASESLAEWLRTRLDIPCELGNPLRSYQPSGVAGRPGQWDVATGLALKEL